MTFENKPGQGALFKVEKKSENFPDWTGKIKVHRTIYAEEEVRLAAWRKDNNQGHFLSLQMSDPFEPTGPKHVSTVPSSMPTPTHEGYPGATQEPAARIPVPPTTKEPDEDLDEIPF